MTKWTYRSSLVKINGSKLGTHWGVIGASWGLVGLSGAQCAMYIHPKGSFTFSLN